MSAKKRGYRSAKRLLVITITAILLTVTALVTRSSTIMPLEFRQWGMATVVHQWGFNLAAWEVDALWQKLRAFVQQPAYGLDYATSVRLVREYLDRAQEMRQIEGEINGLLSRSQSAEQHNIQDQVRTLQQTLDALRYEQRQQRSRVEQIIEAQIAYELANEGFTLVDQVFPPVQFTFVEPPRKLVVSPRDRITTEYSQMLDAAMSLERIEKAEATYEEEFNSSAYITNIGGLGAFPTMVIDRASLPWILSTVAHEWTHNYLTLFPLGINYMTSHELTILNETVADIVGDELGARALRTFYPDPVRSSPRPTTAVQTSENQTPEKESAFEFRTEMRTTRLTVDELLAVGKIEEAEQYMDERRLEFVENGYPLRVLNQAYFAFHGSYGTSAASSSPIGPKMEALRAASPDLKTFLLTVRSFTSITDLDDALASSEQ